MLSTAKARLLQGRNRKFLVSEKYSGCVEKLRAWLVEDYAHQLVYVEQEFYDRGVDGNSVPVPEFMRGESKTQSVDSWDTL